MRTKIKILLLTITSVLFVTNIAKAQTLNYVPKWTPNGSTLGNSLIFDNGTNVGIGTITPASVLDAQASIADIRVTSTTGTNQAFFRTVNTAGSFYMGLNNSIGNALSNAALPYAACFNHSGAYPINFAIQSKDVMTMLSNGNVGIGTTGPNAKLEVSGSTTPGIFVSSTNYPATYRTQLGTQSGAQGILVLGNNGTNEIRFGSTAAGGAGSIYVNNTADYTSAVAGTLAMYFKSDGNVGIGTTSPLAKLHLNNGSVLFDGTTGATPTSGAGTRMMWIPVKGAFRAGAVSSTEWDDGNIGNYTFAAGYATKANGDYSSAMGYNTTASGLQSFASGNSTIVSGNSASAFGYNLVAQSYSSFVIGSWNLNPGTYSTTSAVATDPVFVIGNGTSPSTRATAVTVLKNGNMLINKTTQLNSLYKLDIAGIMRVNEIVVNLTGADFVFNNNYKLLPLKELELFIRKNNHLPEIASAKEMETGDGVKIGEMQTKLLQKIEELTLYIIELNKKIEAIEAK